MVSQEPDASIFKEERFKYSTLNMEAASFSKMLVMIYQVIQDVKKKVTGFKWVWYSIEQQSPR
jgi:hypothetical protein